MAHMGCIWGNDMYDGDGEIVYDVFNKKYGKYYKK